MLYPAKRQPRKSAAMVTAGPAVVIKSTSPISRTSAGEPIKWMAAETGVLQNLRLFISGEFKKADMRFSSVIGNMSATVVYEVTSGKEIKLPDTAVSAGERLTLEFPEKTTDVWLAGVFVRADIVGEAKDAEA